MIVNYVQQQGATAIGHWVATGQLTEGSPLHAALHALLACAGAAASQQHCSSGAEGAAASSVLTGLFSDPRPEDTTQDREAKRNLITSIVTGIASIGNTDPATATHAAIAAVDNNWLATQQVIQMKKDISDAKNNLEMLKVIGKWGGIYTKQEGLTTVGLMNGLGEAGINDIKGMLEFLSDPIAGLKGLKELIVNPEVRQQLGDSVFQELDNKIDRMQTALMVGGDEHAVQYGRDLGSLVWDIGSVAIGVGGVAKAGGALAKAGINVSEDVLERMAARNLEKLVVQQQGAFNKAIALVDKSNSSSEFVFSGLKAKVTPPGSVGGSNKAGNVKVLESEAFSDQKIREFAQQLAGDVPLKETSRKGVYRADLSDGTIVHLRSVSSSYEDTKARWTLVIENNPSLKEIVNRKVEIKFR
ncbi:DUF769 domain-containing protein [Xylella fastidiosa]|uniref:DUF769 domain-containing protein n=3 Tax=Xylella fastidiosa TaxID=2371 RepID=UPI0003D2E5AF|nr:DUF769 domain-containing protein [Xylella fastidiosa]ALR05210.1 DUF769 domain-containing protein [Xylella fastidiosa]OJZ69217.1 hemagglutinin [Xylella fastidiosa 6c]